MHTNSPFPHGIMFHHFHGDSHAKSQGALSQEELSSIIKVYRKKNNILSAKTWLKKAKKNLLKPKDICLSFDDSLLCQYEIALPVLENYNLTAFWFIYSSVIDGNIEQLEIYRKFRTQYFSSIEDFYNYFYYTIELSEYSSLLEKIFKNYDANNYLSKFIFYSDEDKKFRYARDNVLSNKEYNYIMKLMIDNSSVNIQDLSKDLWLRKEHIHHLHRKEHIIGLHSHTHPTSLASLPVDKQASEYLTNYKYIYNLIGSKPETMSHPCDSFNNHTLYILNDLGIKVGFRSNMTHGNHMSLGFPREDSTNIINRIRTNENNSFYK